MNIAIGGAGVVLLLALVVFPGFRKKLKVLVGGFLNIFVEDMAKTPEGARAVYDQAIEVAQKQYNEADNMYKRQAGELDQLRTRITMLKNNLKITEDKCQSLVKSGDIENAKVYAERRSEILAELNQKVNYEHDLALAVEQVKNIHTLTGNKLRKLQTEKKQVIDGMKLDAIMKSVLDDLDDLISLDLLFFRPGDVQREVRALLFVIIRSAHDRVSISRPYVSISRRSRPTTRL